MEPYLNFSKFSFARTVVEEPTKYFDLCRKDKGFFQVMIHSTKGVREEDKEVPTAAPGHDKHDSNSHHMGTIAEALDEDEVEMSTSLLTGSQTLLNASTH